MQYTAERVKAVVYERNIRFILNETAFDFLEIRKRNSQICSFYSSATVHCI